jgi:hypothetical protein
MPDRIDPIFKRPIVADYGEVFWIPARNSKCAPGVDEKAQSDQLLAKLLRAEDKAAVELAAIEKAKARAEAKAKAAVELAAVEKAKARAEAAVARAVEKAEAAAERAKDLRKQWESWGSVGREATEETNVTDYDYKEAHKKSYQYNAWLKADRTPKLNKMYNKFRELWRHHSREDFVTELKNYHGYVDKDNSPRSALLELLVCVRHPECLTYSSDIEDAERILRDIQKEASGVSQ